MKIRKLLLGIGFIILTFAAANFIPKISVVHGATPIRSVALYLGGEKLGPEIRAVQRNRYNYVNLPFLTKYFPVTCDWNRVRGTIQFKFGELSFQMFESKTIYYVNGQKRSLPVAPFERNGQLWLPVQFMTRLGLVVKSWDRNRISLDWDQNYLLGIENVKYEDRPAFLLTGNRKLKIDQFLLSNPRRLVIDLAGVTKHFAMGQVASENPVISGIRVSQMDKKQLRVVFDLKRESGFRFIQDPEQTGRTLLVFNYFIEDIGFEQDQERKLVIKTSNPALFHLETEKEPNRLVLNLKGATLAENITSLPGDGKWVDSVHLNQIDSQTVKVVVDTLSDEPCFVLRSPGDPNKLEIRSTQQISGVHWIETDSGGKLIIQTGGAIVHTFQRLHNPERLQIELPCAKFLPGVRTPDVTDDQVKGIRLVTDSSNNARILVDLANCAGYDQKISADQRYTIISFKKSPIVRKTIVIDAGHGGVDMGAIGRQGTREKDINLDVSMRLKELLEGAGAHVVMTRWSDDYVSLYERAFLANYLFADLFVSVHANNHRNYSIHGSEIYHLPGRLESMLLAEKVAANLALNTGLVSLGVKTNDFVVIRETQMPSILVEMGYLSNFEEEKVLKTDEFRENAAVGIFQGIIEYYQGKQLNLRERVSKN